MAGTSTKTKPVAVRLPVDLVDWAASQGELKVVLADLIREKRDGPKPADGGEWRQRAETAEADVQRLQHEVARLSRDQRVATAKAALSPSQAATVIGVRLGNPVLPATGLPVGGMARGFNLKGKR